MRISSHWVLSTLVVLFLLCCSACAARRDIRDWPAPEDGVDLARQEPVTPPQAAPRLPAPAGLSKARAKQTRFVEADLIKNGSDFELSLPHSGVISDGGDNDFSPNWSGNGLPGSAFCIYRFNAPGYDRNAQLRAEWATAADDGGIFFGVANFDSNRWDWFHGSAKPKLNLPSRSPYFSPADEMLVIVLCIVEAQRLTNLRIGSLPPTAGLNMAVNSGFVPINVTLNASASSDPDGTIVKYEYDLDGDGSFETNAGAEAIFQHNFGSAGFFPITLRVKDDDGLTATATGQFTACAEWIHTLGDSGSDSFASVAYDGHGGIYAAGSSQPSGFSDVLLVKYDLAGTLVWARTWDGGGSENCNAMKIAANGNIILACLEDVDLGAGSRQSLLIQSWSPDGTLLLSSYFSNEDQFFPHALLVDGDQAFVSGTAGGFDNVGLLGFDLANNELDWNRAWTPAGANSVDIRDMVMSSILVLGGGQNINATVAGNLGLDSGNHAFVVHFNNGADEAELDLGSAQMLNLSPSSAGAVLKSGGIIPATIVSGVYKNGSDQNFYLSNLKDGGSPNQDWSSGASSCQVHGMVQRPDGNYTVIGTRFGSQLAWLDMRPPGFGTLAELLSEPMESLHMDSNLASVAGIAGVAGGACRNAQGIGVESITNSNNTIDPSWDPLSLSAVATDLSNIVDLPGTVFTAPALVQDGDSGIDDALLLSRPLKLQ